MVHVELLLLWYPTMVFALKASALLALVCHLPAREVNINGSVVVQLKPLSIWVIGIVRSVGLGNHLVDANITGTCGSSATGEQGLSRFFERGRHRRACQRCEEQEDKASGNRFWFMGSRPVDVQIKPKLSIRWAKV